MSFDLSCHEDSILLNYKGLLSASSALLKKVSKKTPTIPSSFISNRSHAFQNKCEVDEKDNNFNSRSFLPLASPTHITNIGNNLNYKEHDHITFLLERYHSQANSIGQPHLELSFPSISSEVSQQVRIRTISNIIVFQDVTSWLQSIKQATYDSFEGDLSHPIVQLWLTAAKVLSEAESCNKCLERSRLILEEKYMLELISKHDTTGNAISTLTTDNNFVMKNILEKECGDDRNKLIYTALRSGLRDVLQTSFFSLEQLSNFLSLRASDTYIFAIQVVLKGDLTFLFSNINYMANMSPEDILWLYLCCARSMADLADLNENIKASRSSLLEYFGGNSVHYATFLLHALMFEEASKELISNDSTYIDGVHLSLLTGALFNSLDRDDRSRSLLINYSTMLLGLTFYDGNADWQPSYVVISYFMKLGLESEFVKYCSDLTIATRIFGRLNADGSVVGGIAANLVMDPLTDKYCALIEKVAQSATASGDGVLACYMFFLVAQITYETHGGHTKSDSILEALTNATCALMATMAGSLGRFDLLDSINTLCDSLLCSSLAQRFQLPDEVNQSLRLLRSIFYVHYCFQSNFIEDALREVYSVPYFPTSSNSVGQAADRYNNQSFTNDVYSVMPMTTIVVGQLLVKGHSLGSEHASMDRLAALSNWALRWRYPMPKEQYDQLVHLQRFNVS